MLRGVVPVLGAVGVLLAPIDMEGHARSALAIATAMLLSWVVEFLHPGLVGFIGSFLFVATGDVEFETAFAGFATPMPWFFYGTLLLVTAAKRAGIIEALRAMSPQFLTRSVVAASVVTIVLSYVLSMMVPSSLAAATIISLVALAWSTSFVPLLAGAYGAVAFSHLGLAGTPEITGWNLAVAIALVGASLQLSRSLAGNNASTAEVGRPRTGVEWAVGSVVAVAVALWLTTRLHRATPELVGLAAGLACWLPGIARGQSGRHVTADPLALILVGTALSIPAVLIETKAADVLMRLWLTTTPSAGMLPHAVVAYWSTAAYHLFSPDGARPLLPVLDGLATPVGTQATWAYASGTLLSLHQSAALALVMSIAGCRARHVLIAGALVLTASTLVVLIF